jgi:hypothetical protein
VHEEPYLNWERFVDALNGFIIEKCTAPKLDDKLVGPWFIKAKPLLAVPTLDQSYPDELAELAERASKVTEYDKGRDHSDVFDDLLLKFAEARPPGVAARILRYGDYKETERRKFKTIAYVAPSNFYISRTKTFPRPPGTMAIEDFIDGLRKLPAEEATHIITRADIVGKLFLYLWDNVFDRDKKPLEELLGVKRSELRTFGQFVERADNFIERLCKAPDTAT